MPRTHCVDIAASLGNSSGPGKLMITMTSAPGRGPDDDDIYTIGDADIHADDSGDFESRPTRRRASFLPWFLLILVLGAVGAGGFYYVLPMYEALRESERARAQAEEDLVASTTNMGTLMRERTELATERDRLNSELSVKSAALAEIQRAHDELEKALQEEIKQGEVAINNSEGQLSLDVNEKILFGSGDALLSDKGKEVLKRVGETLIKFPEKVLMIGGHTDAVPISGKLIKQFPTNWDLSAARAINVVRFLQDESKIPGERLVAAGYSQYRPTAPNSTPAGRRKNRRIEIALVDPPKKH
jgi:chemotaxis protein MotB